MICDIAPIGRGANIGNEGAGRVYGLRRLSDVLPEIMARYDLRPTAQPTRELAMCPTSNSLLTAATV